MTAAIEIERKFLVRGEDWREAALATTLIRQGYLCRDPQRTVRVRRHGLLGYLTIKSGHSPLNRFEFEYEIPQSDADRMIEELCIGTPIVKRRHIVQAQDGRKWEIDEFEGAQKGLTLAEIELSSKDETFFRPSWLGEEVTSDARYENRNMTGV